MSANEELDQMRLRTAAITGLLYWIVASLAPAHALAFGAGMAFRDCDACSEMEVVPAGMFMMGSPMSEEGRRDKEGLEFDG